MKLERKIKEQRENKGKQKGEDLKRGQKRADKGKGSPEGKLRSLIR